MTAVPEEIGESIVALLPRLRRFARALSRNQHDADDLTQTVVERTWRNLEQFRAGANLAAWMFGIMKNVWIDNRRAQGRRAEVALPEDTGEHPAVSPVDTATTLWSVSEAMSKLPEEQRLAVALVLVEGLSYKEAAEVLEVPIGTLTSRLARGRTALAAALSGEERGAAT
jgi:RNA polymerase sigma-70 factor (ECF subfamily)